MKTCQPRVAQTRSSLYKRFVACRLWLVRYGLALGAVGVGVAARRALDAWLGPGLPTFITYYPVVMLVALAGGLGPGLVATAAAAAAADYWSIHPIGEFRIERPVDAAGLLIFSQMGVFMSVVAEYLRRAQRKAAEYRPGAGPAPDPAREGVPG